MKKKINFHEPYLTGTELNYIKDVFKIKKFYGNGKYTLKCEKAIAKKISNKQVLLTDSCTSALEMSALLIKKTKNDEVILPSYTFTSTAAAFIRAGFRVRFADVDKSSAMIDPQKIEDKINKNTRAVVVVHYAGFAAQIKKIQKICNKYKLRLVEDAAQGFNCFLDNKSLGTFGEFGCFSFHETKNIHSGLSGALVLKKPADYKKAIYIRDRGTNRIDMLQKLKKNYSWVEIGGSFYPTELQAAFLYAQLKYVDENTGKRKKLFNRYINSLNDLLISNRIFYKANVINFNSNFHAMCIFLKSKKIREELRKHLIKKNIQTTSHYFPLHASKIGKDLGYKKSDFPNTNIVSDTILRLPLHNNIRDYEVDNVCQEIKNFFNNH